MSAKNPFSNFVGNSTSINSLVGDFDQPFHAYLFLGPSRVGKKTAARLFASTLLGGSIGNSPDFFEFNNLEDLTSQEARRAISSSARKPLVSAHTIVLIDNLEQLQLEVHNALLKSLEEPGSSRIFLLISHSRNLPQTLVSRCRVVTFNPLSLAMLEQYSKSKGYNYTSEELALAGGAPGVLEDWQINKDKLLAIKNEINKLEHAEDLYQKSLLVPNLANLEVPFLKDVFLAWLSLNKSKLALQPHRFFQLQRLSDSLGDLSAGFNLKLTISRILIG